MKSKIDYSLYLCTDRDLMSSDSIEKSVEEAIKGGVSVVQLREKECSSKEFYEYGIKVKKITDNYKIPLIINDRIDIALALQADGIHLGQSDLPCKIAKEMVKDTMIIGVSVSTVKEAIKAQKEGADYLGVGAMYATNTKTDATIVTIDELINIQKAVTIPIVVIGGINKQTIVNFKNKGISGVAVVSAIISQENVEMAAKELLTLWKH